VFRLVLALIAATAQADPPSPSPSADPDSGEVEGEPTNETGNAAAAPSKSRKKPAGFPVTEDKLRPKRPPRPSGNIHLIHAFRGESLKVNIYNPDGSYDVESLRALSRLLRCTKTDTQRDMEPRLMTVLSHVYDHFGGRPIEVTSGYRNQQRTTSFHYRAAATDILVPGVKATKLRAFVETLDTGGMGIGLYPRSGFVHVDVRPPPSYRWIDLSPVDPDDPGRRPPRGFKKKPRLQS
jgi:uncharacterized protein YcbK (DUF882 family)